MNTDLSQQINQLIERLSNEIELAQKHSLDRTARLLAMAKLDLQTTLYSTSVGDLLKGAEAKTTHENADEASNTTDPKGKPFFD
jgi:hypothetical protein